MTDSKHNNPPDPIDAAIAPYADAIAEAENWLDGQEVNDEASMNAVDAILKDIRAAGTAVNKAEKSEVAPLHDAWKSEKARWKPTIDDIKRMKDGLAALVSTFKQKLAAEKEAERRAAYEEAQRKERELAEAQQKANAADIEQQRELAGKRQEAIDAKKAASAANKDTVKGLRKVTKHEITDMRALVNWIAANDKDAMADFATEYARRNHKTSAMDGVKVWEEKEAY